MTNQIVNATTPQVLGTGDGVTSQFSLGTVAQIIDYAYFSKIWRRDANGNTALYANTPLLGPGRYPQYVFNNALCTRASTATYVGSNGLIQTAGVNVPRYDYSTGSAVLLVESASTNLALYSEQFNAAPWVDNGTTPTVNTDVAPDGSMTMDTITAGNGPVTWKSQLISVSAGMALPFGWYLKQGTGSQTRLAFFDSAYGAAIATLDLSWTAGVPAISSNIGVTGASIKPAGAAGSGIYFVGGTINTGANVSLQMMVYPDLTFTGKSIKVWGAQLGVSGSYIPTTSSVITRAADQISISDYSITSPGTINTAIVPAVGSVLTWEGLYVYHDNPNIPWSVDQTILSEYANSPVLLSLIHSTNDAIDPGEDIDNFYNLVWNINTAQGWGLDVWGRIVGVSRVLTVPGGKTFGYEEAGTVSADPFGQSAFFGGNPATSNYELSDTAFRALIFVKALANISNCSIQTYNTILMQLFPGRGNAYVSDTGNMAARLTFEFPLQPFEIAILKQSGAFVAPTGVLFQILDIQLPYSFGFAEAGSPSAAGFNNGAFFQGYA